VRRWLVPAVGVAAAVVLVAVYFFGSHQPKSAQIAEVKADTEQLRAEQLPLRREIKGLEEVAAREAEFKQALQLLEQLIPSDLAQPSLLVNLQTAADAADVELISVTFGDPEVPKAAPESHVPGTVLVSMPVTVVVDGLYLRITDLLRRVEISDRAVLVGTLALTEADAGLPQLRGTWSGEAFALIPKDHPLVVDQTAPTDGASGSAEEAPAPASAATQQPRGRS
jgi:Tfp pilus assembly protein PilO